LPPPVTTVVPDRGGPHRRERSARMPRPFNQNLLLSFEVASAAVTRITRYTRLRASDIPRRSIDENPNRMTVTGTKSVVGRSNSANLRWRKATTS
jgi:hypothetical protein